MKVYELTPTRENVKSYYRKAMIIEEDGKTALKSYDTIVCYIDSEGLHRTWNRYSATTMRHVWEFVLQMIGMPDMTNYKTCKSWWESLPVIPVPTEFEKSAD